MKKILLINILLLSFLFAFAQFKITGKVVDCETKEPIVWAKVIIKPKVYVFTDIDGNFCIYYTEFPNNIKIISDVYTEKYNKEYTELCFKDTIIKKTDRKLLEAYSIDPETDKITQIIYIGEINVTEIVKVLSDIEEFKGVQVQPLMHPKMKKLNKKKKN